VSTVLIDRERLPGGVYASSLAAEPSAPVTSLSTKSSPKPPQISSAPAAPDFIPPAPTPQDPYPGYYQTPSGEWKAYDPAYYASFFADQASDLQGEKADDGRVGHHWDEYDTKGAHVQEVDVSSSIKAAREEEERKNLMKKPKMPSDEFEYKVCDGFRLDQPNRSALCPRARC